MSEESQLNWKLPLILAVVLVGLGTFAVWNEYTRRPKVEAEEEQTKKPFNLKDVAVSEVRLDDQTHHFALSCADMANKLCRPSDNSKWDLTEPLKSRADDNNANSLLTTLNGLSSTESIDLSTETPEKRTALLKEYGLDPESRKTDRRISIQTASGKTILYLGLTHPIGDGIFAVSDQREDHVMILPSYFKANLEHDLTYWRNKKLFSVASHEIESFDLQDSKGKFSARKKDGQWTIHDPSQKDSDYAGDLEAIDNLLNSAIAITAKDFASSDKNDDKAKGLLKGMKPVVTLKLQPEKGSAKELPAPIELVLYQAPTKAPAPAKNEKSKVPPPTPPAKLYATVGGADPLYELEAATKDHLDKAPKDLRLTKLITSMERFTTKTLVIENHKTGEPAVKLNNVEGKWLRESDKAEVNLSKVTALLDKFSGNHIKDFLTGSAIPGGENQGLEISFFTEKNEKKRDLVFWKNGDKLYARDLSSPKKEAFLIDGTAAFDLPWEKSWYDKEAPKPAQSPALGLPPLPPGGAPIKGGSAPGSHK
jgi:hypothetical protein